MEFENLALFSLAVSFASGAIERLHFAERGEFKFGPGFKLPTEYLTLAGTSFSYLLMYMFGKVHVEGVVRISFNLLMNDENVLGWELVY